MISGREEPIRSSSDTDCENVQDSLSQMRSAAGHG